MSLATERRTVGEYDVATTKLPARRAMKLLAKLVKILGPALVEAKALPANLTLKNMQWSHVAPIVGAAFENLDDAAIDALLKDGFAATSVTVNGEVISLDSEARVDKAFGVNLVDMVGSLLFALEVNFAGFFDRLLKSPAGNPSGEPEPSPSA